MNETHRDIILAGLLLIAVCLALVVLRSCEPLPGSKAEMIAQCDHLCPDSQRVRVDINGDHVVCECAQIKVDESADGGTK